MVARLLRAARQLVRNGDGPTAVECAVLLALLVAVCLGVIAWSGGAASGTNGAVTAVADGGVQANKGSAGATPVGALFDSGCAVSGGTYTVAWGKNSVATYDAATGTLTIADPDGQSHSSQYTPGKLPNIKAGYHWQEQSKSLSLPAVHS